MSKEITQNLNSSYDEDSFWKKLAGYAKAAGSEVVMNALKLYYASQSKDCPAPAKAIVYGALAYFVLPVDAIPDLLPGAGYTDDMGVLAAAVVAIATQINDDVKAQASTKFKDWFG